MNILKSKYGATAILAAGMFCSAFATAAPITFDMDAADKSAVQLAYPIFTGGDVFQASTENGALTLISGAGTNTFLNFGAFAGDVTISFTAAITTDSPFGAGNIGLRIGDNNLVFHPGYPDGAFRIDGGGGHFNVGMGFTPNPYVGSQVTANINSATGQVKFTFVDGLNTNNTFTELFNDTNYVAGSTIIGFTVGGAVKGVFDNLNVQSVAAVPEPETYALFMAGLAIVGAVSRRRRQSMT